MKRGKRLIFLLLALGILLGATYAATLLDPEKEEEEAVTYTTVFSLDPDEVTKIYWDYSEEVSFLREDGGWIYEEDARFPLEESYISTMLEALREIQSSKTIENVENWDQYTLEVPICEIGLTVGGEEHTIKLGKETSMGGERYLSIGDGNAYLVDADILSSFCYGLYDVLAVEEIPSMSDVRRLALSSEVQSYEIRYLEDSGLAYSEDYVWFLEEKALDNELTSSLISSVANLNWTECVDYCAEALSVYGLDAPAATVTVGYVEYLTVDTGETDENGGAIYETQSRDAEFVLEIGSQKDDLRYARIAGSDMVYTIDAALADTLLYTTYYELQPDEVVLLDWEDVTALDISLDAETYTVTRGTKTVTDDEGNESQEAVWQLQGEEVDMGDLLDALEDMDTTGYANGQTPERSEELRLVIHRDHAAFPEVELVFYQYDSAQCLTTLNGEATVFADREQVVELVEMVNKMVL